MADGGSSSGGAAGVTASTGGHVTTSGGQAAAGTGGLPHHIGSCDALAPAGTWEEITPSEVSLEADFKTPAGDNFGDHSFVIDPKDTAHVYLGTSAQGIYESKDCGATWKKINTGRNGDKLDSGRQWTFVIDPDDPQVLYTNAGYGQNNAWKSTNGGVDWDQVLTPNITSAAPYGGFVGGIGMDPSNPAHLLVGWHAECSPPNTKACYAETKNGGVSWTMRNGDPSWGGGEGTRYDILDANTWLFNSESNGMWVSANQGASWSKVQGVNGSHAGGEIYRSANSTLYMGTVDGVMRSIDRGLTWSKLPDSGSFVFGVIGDGTKLYTSSYFPFNAPGPAPWSPYSSTSEVQPATWTTMDSPLMKNGGGLAYDPVHHILYSSNLNAGMWRMVVR
jgi:hypothetical protein